MRRAVAIISCFFIIINMISPDLKGAEIDIPILPMIDIGVYSDIRSDINNNIIDLPENIGVIKDSFIAPGDKVIVHIQDAHCNYYAQQSVRKIINFLNRKYGIGLLCLEGGAGEYDLSMFTEIKDIPYRERVADFFIREGRLSGTEMSKVMEPDNYILWGVEDPGLYLKNLEVYRKSVKHSTEVKKYIENIEKHLNILKQRVYTEDLLRFDANYLKYKNNDMLFQDYIAYLIKESRNSGISIKNYPNIFLLKQVLEEEKKIDFKKANKERETFIEELRKRISRKQVKELAEETMKFRSGAIDPSGFYQYLISSGSDAGLDLSKYISLKDYAVYVSMYSAVNKAVMMEELYEIENVILESMCENDIQKWLVEKNSDFTLMKRAFDFMLTKNDYDRFKDKMGNIGIIELVSFIEKTAPLYNVPYDIPHEALELEDRLREIKEFYIYSFDRDYSFVKKTMDKMDQLEEDEAVLFTGGFHSDNLAELLRAEGISYISIMPSFKSEKGYESPYFRLLGGELSSMSEMVRDSVYSSTMQVASLWNSMGIEIANNDASDSDFIKRVQIDIIKTILRFPEGAGEAVLSVDYTDRDTRYVRFFSDADGTINAEDINMPSKAPDIVITAHGTIASEVEADKGGFAHRIANEDHRMSEDALSRLYGTAYDLNRAESRRVSDLYGSKERIKNWAGISGKKNSLTAIRVIESDILGTDAAAYHITKNDFMGDNYHTQDMSEAVYERNRQAWEDLELVIVINSNPDFIGRVEKSFEEVNSSLFRDARRMISYNNIVEEMMFHESREAFWRKRLSDMGVNPKSISRTAHVLANAEQVGQYAREELGGLTPYHYAEIKQMTAEQLRRRIAEDRSSYRKVYSSMAKRGDIPQAVASAMASAAGYEEVFRQAAREEFERKNRLQASPTGMSEANIADYDGDIANAALAESAEKMISGDAVSSVNILDGFVQNYWRGMTDRGVIPQNQENTMRQLRALLGKISNNERIPVSVFSDKNIRFFETYSPVIKRLLAGMFVLINQDLVEEGVESFELFSKREDMKTNVPGNARRYFFDYNIENSMENVLKEVKAARSAPSVNKVDQAINSVREEIYNMTRGMKRQSHPVNSPYTDDFLNDSGMVDFYAVINISGRISETLRDFNLNDDEKLEFLTRIFEVSNFSSERKTQRFSLDLTLRIMDKLISRLELRDPSKEQAAKDIVESLELYRGGHEKDFYTAFDRAEYDGFKYGRIYNTLYMYGMKHIKDLPGLRALPGFTGYDAYASKRLGNEDTGNAARELMEKLDSDVNYRSIVEGARPGDISALEESGISGEDIDEIVSLIRSAGFRNFETDVVIVAYDMGQEVSALQRMEGGRLIITVNTNRDHMEAFNDILSEIGYGFNDVLKETVYHEAREAFLAGRINNDWENNWSKWGDNISGTPEESYRLGLSDRAGTMTEEGLAKLTPAGLAHVIASAEQAERFKAPRAHLNGLTPMLFGELNRRDDNRMPVQRMLELIYEDRSFHNEVLNKVQEDPLIDISVTADTVSGNEAVFKEAARAAAMRRWNERPDLSMEFVPEDSTTDSVQKITIGAGENITRKKENVVVLSGYASSPEIARDMNSINRVFNRNIRLTFGDKKDNQQLRLFEIFPESGDETIVSFLDSLEKTYDGFKKLYGQETDNNLVVYVPPQVWDGAESLSAGIMGLVSRNMSDKISTFEGIISDGQVTLLKDTYSDLTEESGKMNLPDIAMRFVLARYVSALKNTDEKNIAVREDIFRDIIGFLMMRSGSDAYGELGAIEEEIGRVNVIELLNRLEINTNPIEYEEIRDYADMMEEVSKSL